MERDEYENDGCGYITEPSEEEDVVEEEMNYDKKYVFIVEVKGRFGDDLSYDGPFSNLEAARDCVNAWMDLSPRNKYKIRRTQLFDKFDRNMDNSDLPIVHGVYNIQSAKVIEWDDGRYDQGG